MHVHVLLHVLFYSKLPLTNGTLVLFVAHMHVEEVPLKTELAAERFATIVRWAVHLISFDWRMCFVQNCLKFFHHISFAAYVTSLIQLKIIFRVIDGV